MEEQRETSDGRDVAVICTSHLYKGEGKHRMVPGLPFVPHTASAAPSLGQCVCPIEVRRARGHGGNKAATKGWVWGLAWLACR